MTAISRTTPSTSVEVRPFWRRLLRWFIIAVIILIIADFVLLPLAVAVYAVWPGGGDSGAAPEGFSALTLQATDGTDLAAWYAPPENGRVIILLPGSGNTREDVRSQAVMLRENGYGVLSFDPRGIGESGGQTNRFGWAGTSDVGGAVAFLEGQPENAIIGAWGFSMGGEILLGAVGEYPQIVAVIADGATYRSVDEEFDLPSAGNALAHLHSEIITTLVRLISGDEPPLPIMASLEANSQTRLLLIAAGKLDSEIDYNTMFASVAGERAEIWVAPDVGHTDAWGRYREDYEQRVLNFFSQSLDS